MESVKMSEIQIGGQQIREARICNSTGCSGRAHRGVQATRCGSQSRGPERESVTRSCFAKQGACGRFNTTWHSDVLRLTEPRSWRRFESPQVEVQRLSNARSVVPVRGPEDFPQRQTQQSADESHGQNEREAKPRVTTVDRARVFEQLEGDEQHGDKNSESKTSASDFLFRAAHVHDEDTTSIPIPGARQHLDE